jgi:hypothetical protein
MMDKDLAYAENCGRYPHRKGMNGSAYADRFLSKRKLILPPEVVSLEAICYPPRTTRDRTERCLFCSGRTYSCQALIAYTETEPVVYKAPTCMDENPHRLFNKRKLLNSKQYKQSLRRMSIL